MSYNYTYLDPDYKLPYKNEKSKTKKYRKNKIARFIGNNKKFLIKATTVILFFGFSVYLFIYATYYRCVEPVITEEHYSKIKGEPYFDKYGIDLNQYMEKEMYSQKIPGNDTLDNWELYTPICPHLEPIHYPEEIINPNCENTGIQIVDFHQYLGKGIPHTLHLHNITNQIKNWKEWSKRDDKVVPNYYNRSVEQLVEDTYHPFDYGYYDEEEIQFNNEKDKIKYYKKVINSRMDEVPDPRHRRLFSFILFNTEFDLLDVYLSEYYEVFDYFVIYESNATFSRNPKPLYFTRMLLETNRYDRFKDKIIAFPLPSEKVCEFPRENFTKEHLARRQLIEMGLRAVQARHGDIFLHGDLDEVARPHILARLKKCGGWEHLQAGIGGGPQSSREKKVDSYLQDEKLNSKLERDKYGFPKLVYDRDLSIGFLNWFYEYSFSIVEDTSTGTTGKPNIAIFDARRALGQYPKRYDYAESEGDGNIMPDDKYTRYNRRSLEEDKSNETEDDTEKYVDPLTQPGFDPYKGYSYTDNANDKRKGQGYLGEFMRFTTKYTPYGFSFTNYTLFWNGGWHMSSFLPTIDHFVNKLTSYSHYNEYSFLSEEKRRQTIISHINNKSYIFNSKSFFIESETVYQDNTIYYPEDAEKGYQYDFSYDTWHTFITDVSKEEVQNQYVDMRDKLFHEIPNTVWKNPVCYSYMLDRQFGLTKKLWWQQIPKEEWSTVDFDTLDKETLEKMTPANIPNHIKPKPLRDD